MSIDIQADDVAQDGSITVKLDGKSVKYVKESDLGAVKGALTGKDTEISKLQTDLAGANSKYDKEHQDLLQERASKVGLEKDAGKSATLTTKVGELETKLADLEKVGGETETKLTERLRLVLTEGYKIDAEKIKDMALGDLEKTEANLILVGAKPAPANYDGKGGPGTGSPDDLKGKSPLQLATMGYEESTKKK